MSNRPNYNPIYTHIVNQNGYHVPLTAQEQVLRNTQYYQNPYNVQYYPSNMMAQNPYPNHAPFQALLFNNRGNSSVPGMLIPPHSSPSNMIPRIGNLNKPMQKYKVVKPAEKFRRVSVNEDLIHKNMDSSISINKKVRKFIPFKKYKNSDNIYIGKLTSEEYEVLIDIFLSERSIDFDNKEFLYDEMIKLFVKEYEFKFSNLEEKTFIVKTKKLDLNSFLKKTIQIAIQNGFILDEEIKSKEYNPAKILNDNRIKKLEHKLWSIENFLTNEVEIPSYKSKLIGYEYLFKRDEVKFNKEIIEDLEKDIKLGIKFDQNELKQFIKKYSLVETGKIKSIIDEESPDPIGYIRNFN